eukprot:CAMPEP_0174746086 /NCGR_PEP_ID=MMETSP1094-20130205/88312_1 /TAXON_ID=156173 /ORGANISM="Chrysochromulina brevifilum, Strain UTEX LB 985" /LENGTH=57 /DNA_ID=CAMNT_0015950749 /DNA_START=393 /DNA_END=566 /DNA_ORIENTATION=-
MAVLALVAQGFVLRARLVPLLHLTEARGAHDVLKSALVEARPNLQEAADGAHPAERV